MAESMIKKYNKQISTVLSDAAVMLSYNGCNDIPESFWEGLTYEDKQEILREALREGVIDKEAFDAGWIGDVDVAILFSKWVKKL